MDMLGKIDNPQLKLRLRDFLEHLNEFPSPERAFEAFLAENEDLLPSEEPSTAYNFDTPLAQVNTMNSTMIQKWQRLLDLTTKFAKLAPWKTHMETEIYGVQDPITKTMYYCSIMGNRGENFSIFAYLGGEGLANFLHFETDFGYEGPDPYYFLLHQIGMQILFEPQSDLQPPDILLLQKLHYYPKNAKYWPKFRDYTPGFLPWFVTEQQLDLLTRILEQSLLIIPQLTEFYEGPKAIFDDYGDLNLKGAIPCRIYTSTKSGGTWETEWQKLASVIPFTPPSVQIELPITMKKSISILANRGWHPKGIWEMGVFYTEDIFQTTDERPYFGQVAVIVDRTTKYILMAELLPNGPMATNLYNKMMELIQRTEYLPKTIFVTSANLFTILTPLADILQIILKHGEKMRVLNEVIQSMPHTVIS